MDDRCGVYVIEMTATGKHYIGSSSRIRRRWYEHRRLLDAGKHHAAHLQRAWTKHGPDAFRFWVIEECPKEQLLEREQEYLDAFRPVFNVCPEARSKAGTRDTPETRAKKSAGMRAVLASRTHCPQGHPYDEANTIWYRGSRRCRACGYERSKTERLGETPEEREQRLSYLRAYYEHHREERVASRYWLKENQTPEQYARNRARWAAYKAAHRKGVTR